MRRRSLFRIAAFVIALASFLFAASTQAQPATTTSQTSAEYAAAFKDLYDHLGKVYPCFEMKKIDWTKVGDELIPRSAQIKSDADFGLLCLRLIARLQDSHAQLLEAKAKYPEIAFPQWDPGFACVIDDRDRPVVYYLDKGSPAEKAGVKIGMAVVSINGKSADAAMKAWEDEATEYSGYSSDRALRYDAAKMFVRQMQRGAKVRVVTQDPDGKPSGFEITATLGVRYLPRLPVPIHGIDDSGSVEPKHLNQDVGYIYVRRINENLIDGLDRALRLLGSCKAIIIDVRGNSGGGFDADRSFRNFDLDDKEEPDRPRFKGKIALLLDERTISAAEGWASWFIAKKRAKTFGSTTSGASSRKDEYTLTNGLYKVIVPVKAYDGFLDRPIERRGLEPDIPVRVNAKDLTHGKDTVLETAKKWLMTSDESAK
jgi:C-terminal processing protease CtpA/Prc